MNTLKGPGSTGQGGLEGKKDGWLDEWMIRMIGTEDGGHPSEIEKEEAFHVVKRSETEIGENLRNLRIVKVLERSVELNPFEAQYQLRLGWEYAHLWKEADYHTKWLPAADISMDRAAYFAGVKNPHLHQELGNYWTMRSKSVLPNNQVHHEAWAKACWHYRKAQSLETGGELKRMQKEIRDYVWNSYPDEGFVEQVIASENPG